MIENFNLRIAKINNDIVEDLPRIFRLFNRLQGSVNFNKFTLYETPYEKNKDLKAFRIIFTDIANCGSIQTNQEFNKYLQEISKDDPELIANYRCSLNNAISCVVLFTKLTARFSYHSKNLDFLTNSFKTFLTLVMEFNFLAHEESKFIKSFVPKIPIYVYNIKDPTEQLFMIINNKHEDISYVGVILDSKERYFVEVLQELSHPVLQ